MRSRRLPLYVPGDLYEQIEALAEAQERTPIQQSVWLIKRALGDQPDRDRELTTIGGADRPQPDQAA